MIGSRGAGPQQLTILIVLAVLLVAMPATARAASSGGAPPASSSRRHHRRPGVGASQASLPWMQCRLDAAQHAQPVLELQPAAAGGERDRRDPGALAKTAATGIMDQVTAWMVQAAQTVSGWVVKEAGVITTPDLNAGWYLRLFSGLAALGGALAGLVGLIALASAAIRRDPDALGEVIYGVARAGIGTSIVIAMTVIGARRRGRDRQRLRAADAGRLLQDASRISGEARAGAGSAPRRSAFLVAFVATIAGLLVWLELIVREAAIYIAVLFFPVGLAASIWPALRSWVRRLSMLLLMFVLLRPVVVIVLALAGSVTASGLSFGNGSIPHSVGTILAGVVIFALAAFTPWALMFLLGTEIGVMYSRGGSGGGQGGRSSTGSGVGGGLAAEPALAGGGGGGLGGAGEGAEGASAGRAGGSQLSSLGGAGSGGAAASGGSIAAAAGWIGAAAGVASRVGGQLGQHGAARIHVAAGRGGVAPGRHLPTR